MRRYFITKLDEETQEVTREEYLEIENRELGTESLTPSKSFSSTSSYVGTTKEIDMNTEYIVNKIKGLLGDSNSLDYTEKHLLHAAEELGECSRARRDLRNGKGSQEHLVEECVDLIITGFASFLSSGGNVQAFDEYFEQKCAKWQKNIEKGKSK